MTAIKASAVWPLLPISCGADDYPVSVDASSLQSGITEYFSSYSGTPPNWVNQLPTRMSYAMDKTNVTLDPPVSGGLYAEHEDIVAHVDHTFYLSIPYLAKAFGMFGGVELDWGNGRYYGVVISVNCRLPNEGVQDYVDVETFGG